MKLIASAFPLRDYQIECIKASITAYKNGIRRQAISLPVGSGKTVILSNIILNHQPLNKSKSLILAHRHELVQQAFTSLKLHNPNSRVAVEQGIHKPKQHDFDIVVASVSSLISRLDLYKPEEYKAIVIDEAHHAAASTYKRILDHFKDNSNLLILGVSATLKRHDGIGLSAFDEIVYEKSFNDMVRDKYLCNFRYIPIRTMVDLPHSEATDYSVSKLSKIVNNPKRNALIVDTFIAINEDVNSIEWKNHDGSLLKQRKSTLIFAVDIAHINELITEFANKNVIAKGISSKTHAQERKSILQEFRDGSLLVLINCGILTEGVDIPRIDCLFLARPTKSVGLLHQMLGRGLRLYPEKDLLCVVDFVDVVEYNQTDFGSSAASLLGLPDEFMTSRKMYLKLQSNIKKFEPKIMMDSSESAFTEYTDFFSIDTINRDMIAIQRISNSVWIRIGPADFCHVCPDYKTTILILHDSDTNTWNSIIDTKISNNNKIFHQRKFVSRHSEFESTIRGWDSWLNSKYGRKRVSSWTSSWRRFKASQDQIKYLERFTKDENLTSVTKGVASDMIVRIAFGGMKKAKLVEKHLILKGKT